MQDTISNDEQGRSSDDRDDEPGSAPSESAVDRKVENAGHYGTGDQDPAHRSDEAARQPGNHQRLSGGEGGDDDPHGVHPPHSGDGTDGAARD